MTSAKLPLSSFEHLMVAQDRPAYPCVVYCRMHFQGCLDPEAFLHSLRDMLDRHPLLRSRVERSWRGLYWVHETSDCVPIHWISAIPEDAWVDDSRLDLFSEVGTKVFIHQGPHSVTVVFQCHHACVDGLGLQSALNDLWLLYDNRTNGTQRKLPPYDSSLLRKRNHFGMTLLSMVSGIRKQAVGLLGVRQYLMRDPVPVLPHDLVPDANPTPLPASCHVRRFDRSTVQQLRDAASQRDATLNELVACSVFEAIARFREQRGFQNAQEWIRMMVPVNMRTTREDEMQTACNIVSSIFLDRTSGQIADRRGLLWGIHQEMELIKRNRLGLVFIASLWLKKQWPSNPSSKSLPGRCQTTVVVTNVGRSFGTSPLRSPDGEFSTGNLRLDSITMLAPMTPFLSAALTINEYAGELCLALRYDSRVLQKDAARELLERIVASLMEWLGESADSAKA